MSKTPEIKENPAARMLPVIWFMAIVALVLIGGVFLAVKKPADESFDSIKKQFESFVSTTVEQIKPTGLPVLTPVPSSFPTTKKLPTRYISVTPRVANCIRLNIREGEFASNKCYSRVDYDNLSYYISRFSSASFDLQTAQGTIKITCNCRVQQECDFFKDSCAEAQQQKTKAETDMNNYRSIIKGIIARGK